MPVVPRCPRCQGILAGTGQRERCLRCGEMVVAVLRKLCSRCGRDVTASPRTKDAAGEYFCQPCWLEICEAQEEEPAYQCGECGGLFISDQVFAEKTQYVCKGCFAARATDPGGAAIAVLSGLAAAEQSPDTAPLGYIPNYYTSTAAARIEERAKRSRLVLILSLVGATVLIVGLTVLMIWRGRRGSAYAHALELGGPRARAIDNLIDLRDKLHGSPETTAFLGWLRVASWQQEQGARDLAQYPHDHPDGPAAEWARQWLAEAGSAAK